MTILRPSAFGRTQSLHRCMSQNCAPRLSRGSTLCIQPQSPPALNSSGSSGCAQLKATSGVVAAIISCPRLARGSMEKDKRGTEVRALGIGPMRFSFEGSGENAGDLGEGDVSECIKACDERALIMDSASRGLRDPLPLTSSVDIEDAQLTRLPFEGLEDRPDLRGGVAMRLDFRIAGLMGIEEDRFLPDLAMVAVG